MLWGYWVGVCVFWGLWVVFDVWFCCLSLDLVVVGQCGF